jgi:peptidoglycan-associated lipoprotein
MKDTVAIAGTAGRPDTLLRAAAMAGLAILLSATVLLAQQSARGPTANVHFDFGESRVRPDAAETLEQMRRLMRTTPAMRVRVEGHADARGPSAYNVALSQRRADAVKLWLVEHGIAADRIETASFGDERPLCRENEESCWSRNRRDELLIVAGGDVAMLIER